MHTDKKAGGYKYEDLTGKIIACAFEVQNSLGCGFLEKVYHKALLHEFQTKGLKVETHKPIKIVYKGEEISTYIADFVIDGKVIVEVKTVEFLTQVHICGLPVIATKIGQISKVIKNGQNGILVNDNNIDEIIRNILFLKGDPNTAKKIGKEARKDVGDYYNWERVAAETEKILEDLL